MLVRCTVTLPPSSPVHYAASPGRTGAVFIEEFREPRRRILRLLAIPIRLFALVFPEFVAPAAAFFVAVLRILAASG